jgi:hypothetical protein
VHEIKHDGYRLIARRTDRYPRIIDALRSIRARSVTIDGEAVVCGKDGKSDFDQLRPLRGAPVGDFFNSIEGRPGRPPVKSTLRQTREGQCEDRSW